MVVAPTAIACRAGTHLPADNEPVEMLNASSLSFPVCHWHGEFLWLTVERFHCIVYINAVKKGCKSAGTGVWMQTLSRLLRLHGCSQQ